jgi:hypothetical protein
VSSEERCRGAAARYRSLRKLTNDPDTRRAYGELERLWLEMAAVAEEFDIDRADAARARLDAMIKVVETYRRKQDWARTLQ